MLSSRDAGIDRNERFEFRSMESSVYGQAQADRVATRTRLGVEGAAQTQGSVPIQQIAREIGLEPCETAFQRISASNRWQETRVYRKVGARWLLVHVHYSGPPLSL